MSFFASLFGAARSAVTSTASSPEAERKRDELNVIFNGLIRNTNEIDIIELTKPNLCQGYVFQLHRAFQDMQEARKAKELKTLVMDSKDSSDSFESIVFHPIKRKRPTDAEMCKEMSVFHLELIFLLYTVVLSTNKQYNAPTEILDGRRTTLTNVRRTRRRQRGGARPQEDLSRFIENSNKYPVPSSNFFQYPDSYRQLYPASVDDIIPNELVMYQHPSAERRYIEFWVYLQGKRSIPGRTPIQFYCDFDNAYSSDTFTMTIYRCASFNRFEPTYPVLKAPASITRTSEGGLRFTITIPVSICQIYSISDSGPHSMDHIARILLVAAKAELSQINTNKSVILDQGRRRNIGYIPLGTTVGGTQSSGVASASNEFATTATNIRKIMAVNRNSLVQIRLKMLTPDGDRVQPMTPLLKTEHIATVLITLARGVSNFNTNPAVLTRLQPILEEFEQLRKNNERIFTTLSGRLPRLSQQRLDQLTALRTKMENIHNAYTLNVGKIITSKVVKSEGGNYKINPDFTIVTETRLSTLKKIDRVVEEVAEIMIKYYIEIERIFLDGLTTTLSYTGGVI